MSGDNVKPSLGSCELCGRPLRRRREPAQEGLVCAQRPGLCKSCYMRGRQPVHHDDDPVTVRIQIPPVEILNEALCAQIGAGVDGTFFPDYGDARGAELAKTICHACPVIDACLDWALANREQHGIWGGTSPKVRKLLLRERRQAA